MLSLVFVLLVAKGGRALFESTYALRLTRDYFMDTVKENHGDKEWLLVEFYADWCPHCQAFDPHFQALAEAFMTQSTSNVVIGHVSCVTEPDLCQVFSDR